MTQGEGVTIFIDDGSTNVKLAWFESDKLKNHISPNSFRLGWTVDILGSKEKYNYEINGKKYTYAPTDHRVLKTTNLHFQYDTLDVIAIHHALETARFSAGEYNIVVTLPISEYYSSDNQRNIEKINKKVRNVKENVLLNGDNKFKFNEVSVLPESIPAVMRQLDIDDVLSIEKSLVIDLGGTTLDCGVITGKYDSVNSVHGNPEIGVSLVTEKVKSVLSTAHSETSDYIADIVIQNRDNDDLLKKIINDKNKISDVKKTIDDGCNILSSLVVSDIERYHYVNRIYLVGGGSHLIEKSVKEKFKHLGDRVKIIESPQLALVTEMALMGK